MGEMFSKKKKDDKSASSSSTSSHTNNTSVVSKNGAQTKIISSVSQTTTATSYTRIIREQETLISVSAPKTAGTLQGPSNRLPIISTSIFDRPRSQSLLQTDARPIPGTLTSFNSHLTSSPRTIVTPNYRSAFNRGAPTYHSYTQPSAAIKPSQIGVSSTSLNAGEQIRDPRIPTYQTNGKKRGRVLIINNVKFLSKRNKERIGAVKDEEDVSKLFRAFGFDVEKKRDLKCAEMYKAVKNFRKKSFKEYDISIVIMMSHGNNYDKHGNRIKGGYTEIYGIDDEGLPIDDVLNEFSTETCPDLSGKPKIFIFQCCRGSEDEIAKDAAPIVKAVKSHADMLIAFSTLPGFSSNRDPEEGTWYIQSICDVFKNHAKAYDIEQLLKIVDQKLGDKHPKYKQTSTYESRGFKRCYLNPK